MAKLLQCRNYNHLFLCGFLTMGGSRYTKKNKPRMKKRAAWKGLRSFKGDGSVGVGNSRFLTKRNFRYTSYSDHLLPGTTADTEGDGERDRSSSQALLLITKVSTSLACPWLEMLYHPPRQPSTILLQSHPESDIRGLEDGRSGKSCADGRKIQNRVNARAAREFTKLMSSRVNI